MTQWPPLDVSTGGWEYGIGPCPGGRVGYSSYTLTPSGPMPYPQTYTLPPSGPIPYPVWTYTLYPWTYALSLDLYLTPPPGPVKTLPSCNYCCGRYKCSPGSFKAGQEESRLVVTGGLGVVLVGGIIGCGATGTLDGNCKLGFA